MEGWVRPTGLVFTPCVLRVHSWCCIFNGFMDKSIMTCTHHHYIVQYIFTALKAFCAPPSHLFLPSTPSNHSSFIFSKVWSFLVCHIVVYNTQLSQTGFCHLVAMHLRLVHVFSCLIAQFFLAVNNILMSGCTTVYSYMHLLKDILLAFKFW